MKKKNKKKSKNLLTNNTYNNCTFIIYPEPCPASVSPSNGRSSLGVNFWRGLKWLLGFVSSVLEALDWKTVIMCSMLSLQPNTQTGVHIVECGRPQRIEVRVYSKVHSPVQEQVMDSSYTFEYRSVQEYSETMTSLKDGILKHSSTKSSITEEVVHWSCSSIQDSSHTSTSIAIHNQTPEAMSKDSRSERDAKNHDKGGKDASNNVYRKPWDDLMGGITHSRDQAKDNDAYNQGWRNTRDQQKK